MSVSPKGIIWHQVLLLALLGLTVALVPRLAQADEAESTDLDPAQCIQHHSEGQRLSKAGDLKGALSSFTACSTEQCPSVVSSDCISFRESVQERLPSAIFSVTSGEGQDLSNYQVLMDGEMLVEKLDGRSIPVNPGRRQITFVDESGKRHEQAVVFREGEKSRRIDYQLPQTKKAPEPEVSPALEPKSGIHPLTWIGGGVAVAGGGAFAGLALAGNSKRKSLEKDCSPRCTDDDVARVKSMYLAADIAMGVGIAGAATAIVGLFLPYDKKPNPEKDISLTVIPGFSGRSMLICEGRF